MSHIDTMWLQELRLRAERCLIVKFLSKREYIEGHIYRSKIEVIYNKKTEVEKKDWLYQDNFLKLKYRY